MIEKVKGRPTVIRIGRISNLFTFALLFLLPCFVWAETTVIATVDRNQVGVGDTFTLKVSVKMEDSLPVGQPGLPTIANVQLMHNWVSNQSSSSMVSTGQGVDFKTVITKIFSYQFAVLQQGDIRIDPVTVEVDGKSYKTKPISIEVSKQGLAQRQPQRPQQPQRPNLFKDPMDQMEETFNNLLNRNFGGVPGGFMTEPRNANEAFFILAEVDKTEAYKGEQITASWYLYTRGRVRDIDTLKYPTLKGFWKEDIQISTHLNFEQDVINGVPYNRALLASYALFPIEEGKKLVDPYRAKASIVSGFGFGKAFQATKSSDKIPVLIKPLPAEGKPMDFTGAVGEFQLTVEAPTQPIVTHQPFPLKVRFEGRGNAKLIDLPELPLGDQLEIYDIKNESQFFRNGQSFKEFEVLLIPKNPGPLTIAPLRSSFFDPKTAKYVSLESDEISLTVLPGSKQQSIGEERLKSDQEKKVLPQIAAEWNPNYQAAGRTLFVWPLLYLIAILFLVYKAIVDSGLLNRKPSLEDILKIRFGKMDRLLAKTQLREVGIEATNTVYLVLGELSGEGGASEELEKILAKTAPSVRREIEEPVKKLMDYFGVLGFGPASFVKDFKDKSGLKKKVEELRKLLLKACQLSKGSVSVED